MTLGRWQIRWLFNRRTGWLALWTILLLTAAITINLFGIRLAGSIDRWQAWMDEHAGFFFLWRLMLYTITVYGWLWMRKRLRDREPDKQASQRLTRMEIAAVLAILVLEISLLLQAR